MGYDYGFARVRGGKDSNFGEGMGRLSSSSLGFKAGGNNYNLNLTYAMPISEPNFNEQKDYEIYAVLTINF